MNKKNFAELDESSFEKVVALALSVSVYLPEKKESGWAIFDDENFLGFICWRCLIDELEILSIAICPEYQKKGIGYQLLQLFISTHQKYKNVFLEVKINNKTAIYLYQKIGFHQIGIRKDYYHENNHLIDAVIMRYEFKTE